MLNKVKIGYTMILSWGTLGFYRGVKDYDYYHNYQHKLKESNEQKEPYLYSNIIINNADKILCGGIYGLIMYINPVLIFLTLPKEIYRFEVCVRNLENEKKSERYNKLF